ncbi:MAG TPA: crosslink repair DNA glycosylase YcaQ family protein, partial [Chthoniobacter sp.]|nr:crosslink repair DNA glycosylase YcaQ family protein [Chthoniobacter sp.]
MPELGRLNIARLRLRHQQIAVHRFQRPGQVVAWLGALQAQDYPGALWSIGLRLPQATQKDVEKAIAAHEIVRTWPIRGTLHFVAAADVHWMRALLTPRIIARSALRQRQLELDAAIFARCEKIFLKALRGGGQLTREQMLALLEKERITTAGQRGYHILWRLAQEGLLCFGPHAGKQPTFTLLEEWIPTGRQM